MMKSFKLLSALLAATVLLSACSGGTTPASQSPAPAASGSSQEKSLYTPVGSYPIVNEPIKLSIFVPQYPNVIDYETNTFSMYLEEKTGVELSFEMAPKANLKEKLNLLMSTGDIPDMILLGPDGGPNFPDEAKFGVEEGMLMDLTSLIETQMPNFKKAMADNDNIRGGITSTDGKIYSLPYYAETFHMEYSHKMWVNTMWLEKMGEEPPKTTDDLYRICKKFKEMNPTGIPIAGAMGMAASDPLPWLINAFDYSPDIKALYGLTVKDGKVDTSFATEGYREALRFLNKLYKEGLLYENVFTTNKEQAKALIASEGEPILFMPVHATVVLIDSATNPELYKHYTPIAPVKGPGGVQYATYIPSEPTASFGISADCKYPEAAARIADYFYTLEGFLDSRWGPKGPTTWDDPMPGQKGITGQDALYQVFAPYSHEPQNTCWIDGGLPYGPAEVVLGVAGDPDIDIYAPTGLEKWMYNATKDLYAPYKPTDIMTLPKTVKLTQPESQSLQTVGVELDKFITDSKVKFITGASDVDKDWDAYMGGLNSIGLPKLLETYQTAYNRQFQ